MRAWKRFRALDNAQGPLKFKVLLGGKRFAVLAVWKTTDPAWTKDSQPLRPV